MIKYTWSAQQTETNCIQFANNLFTIITKNGITHLSGMFRQIRFTGGLHELSTIQGSYESPPPDPPRINNINYICIKYCPKGLDHLRNILIQTKSFNNNGRLSRPNLF